LRFKSFSVIIIVFLTFNISYSQLIPKKFSIAGGPTIGWFFNNTDDLNAEMTKIGMPAFSTDGFLLLGGGGFVDVPLKSIRWLRVGGSGEGFTTQSQITSGNITRTAYYHYGSGGISLDYVKSFGKSIELTLGAYFATGKLTIQFYQNNSSFGNWNNIIGQYGGDSTTQNFSNKLSVRFYSARPQIGLGVFITSYLYAKLNAGYQFSANNSWYVDDDIPVTDAPTGIKADGLILNFGLNFGLFIK